MPITAVLVDDDEDLSQVLIPVLEDFADVNVVEVAHTPVEALALMAKYELDWQLLILDIDLRNGSGLDVLNACSHRLPHQLIIVLTNLSTPQVRSRCLSLGVDAVFDKTAEIDAFLKHCQSLKRHGP
ncbi:MAG: hypothetical protein JWP79_628 [Polaromonas sp.]|jgi:DNA-binding NarL/FixJ family response regulator|nr:hypothetical protein [Polaromonas sp.]